MRLKDLRDFFRLRRHMRGAWGFVRTRRDAIDGARCPVALRAGGVLTLRAPDRGVFKDVYARDEYGLDGRRPGELGTVVDVGAHAGIFAVRAAPLAERVICYEPSPENFAVLGENTRALPNVSTVQAAVAGQRGSATLFLDGDPASHSLFKPPKGAQSSVVVETVTLEDVFARHAIAECGFLKLDGEGAEYDILFGASDELLRRVRRIALEYHIMPDASKEWSGHGLARRLERAGHRVRLRERSRHAGKGVLLSERL